MALWQYKIVWSERLSQFNSVNKYLKNWYNRYIGLKPYINSIIE